MKFYTEPIAKSPRIPKLVEALYEKTDNRARKTLQ